MCRHGCRVYFRLEIEGTKPQMLTSLKSAEAGRPVGDSPYRITEEHYMLNDSKVLYDTFPAED